MPLWTVAKALHFISANGALNIFYGSARSSFSLSTITTIVVITTLHLFFQHIIKFAARQAKYMLSIFTCSLVTNAKFAFLLFLITNETSKRCNFEHCILPGSLFHFPSVIINQVRSHWVEYALGFWGEILHFMLPSELSAFQNQGKGETWKIKPPKIRDIKGDG